MNESVNDNEDAPVFRGSPDPHGQAAMLLLESLIHGLIARSVLSIEDATEVVEVAIDVKREIAADLGDTPAALRKSIHILEAISLSLSHDL